MIIAYTFKDFKGIVNIFLRKAVAVNIFAKSYVIIIGFTPF
jgi:hypothetical protein